VEPFGDGLINKTWRIKNSSDDYILQKINHTIFKHPGDIAANVRMLADYLLKAHPDFLFIKPIKTKNGDEIVYIEGEGYFRLCHYVKQSHTINAVEKTEQAYEAAKKFGQFTKILSGFHIDNLKITLPDFHNLSLRYQQFTEALKKGNKERIQQSKDLIDFIIANKKIVETYENILHNPSFKLRVTHHDTKISNVLFDKNDKGLCVIDLDTVMAGYFISDTGDMIRTYLSPVDEEEQDFSKIEIREEYFSAIRKGYMSEMSDELSTEEKDHFIYSGKFMIYMQAIRFLTDYLNNDVYYGAKYEDHNLIRAKNQATLLQRLIEKEEKLKSLVT
jgi:Ser/Thr protein kinase RdoA (MazF antagonist)